MSLKHLQLTIDKSLDEFQSYVASTVYYFSFNVLFARKFRTERDNKKGVVRVIRVS